MKIAMGNDHTAIELKNIIKEFVEGKDTSGRSGFSGSFYIRLQYVVGPGSRASI